MRSYQICICGIISLHKMCQYRTISCSRLVQQDVTLPLWGKGAYFVWCQGNLSIWNLYVLTISSNYKCVATVQRCAFLTLPHTRRIGSRTACFHAVLLVSPLKHLAWINLKENCHTYQRPAIYWGEVFVQHWGNCSYVGAGCRTSVADFTRWT